MNDELKARGVPFAEEENKKKESKNYYTESELRELQCKKYNPKFEYKAESFKEYLFRLFEVTDFDELDEFKTLLSFWGRYKIAEYYKEFLESCKKETNDGSK